MSFKMIRGKTIISSLFLLLAAGLYSGCASYKLDDGDPEALYRAAERDFNSDRFQLAAEKLRTVRNKFPYSHYSILAQLKLADVYYEQESYLEAAVAYETFVDLHPNHEKASYAKYRVADSYLKDCPANIARDQSSAKKAEDAFLSFMQKYPNAPEIEEVKKGLISARTRQAKKEFYIGEHYRRWEFYDSARARYKNVLDKFSDTDVTSDARAAFDSIIGKSNPPPPESD